MDFRNTFPTIYGLIPRRTCNWHFWSPAEKVHYCGGCTRMEPTTGPNRMTSRGTAKIMKISEFRVASYCGLFSNWWTTLWSSEWKKTARCQNDVKLKVKPCAITTWYTAFRRYMIYHPNFNENGRSFVGNKRNFAGHKSLSPLRISSPTVRLIMPRLVCGCDKVCGVGYKHSFGTMGHTLQQLYALILSLRNCDGTPDFQQISSFDAKYFDPRKLEPL